MNTNLQQLLNSRKDLWRGNSQPRLLETLSTGIPALDEALPGRGWPLGSLIELMPETYGIGEFALLLPVLAAATQRDQRVALIAPPFLPYAPALSNAGVELKTFLIIQANNATEVLWSAEQLLRSGLFNIIVLWIDKTNHNQQRRLQLAAEAGKICTFCYRPMRCSQEHSVAALRIVLQYFVNNRALQLDIIKIRSGGRSQQINISDKVLFNARHNQS